MQSTNKEKVQIKDKKFELYISESEIKKSIQKVAERINTDYKGEEVIFVGVLNGAFMFAAELMKDINLTCEISFVKVTSYKATSSTGKVHELIGLNTEIKDKHVVILEDIVDSGLTLSKLYSILDHNAPKSVEVATLLYKPDAFQGKFPPKYVGLEIPNKFIVGYGLDYMEVGRNSRNIYKIIE